MATGRRPAVNALERVRCISEPSWPAIRTECMAITVLRTPSVLLVNDALDEREMYARTLRAAGYHALEAENSIAACRSQPHMCSMSL